MDVERVTRIHNYLKRYLNWIQNSVFEGELGEADFVSVKKYLSKIIDKEHDSVLIFKFRDKYAFEKEVVGKERNVITNVI